MFKNYVSEIDQCLEMFDKQHHTLSLSQQREKAKSQRISQLRDSIDNQQSIDTIWDNF